MNTTFDGVVCSIILYVLEQTATLSNSAANFCQESSISKEFLLVITTRKVLLEMNLTLKEQEAKSDFFAIQSKEVGQFEHTHAEFGYLYVLAS